MRKNHTIESFLREELGYPASKELAQLGALAGKRIGGTSFFADLDVAREHVENWMPIFFLPIARTSFTLGLHLRPSDVKSHRLAFVEAQDPGELVEVALTPPQAVYLALLSQQAFSNGGKMPSSLLEGVAIANELFGAGFYDIERHADVQSGDESIVMTKVFGGTPAACCTDALLADDSASALTAWERGIALGTESLVLYAGAARTLLARGNDPDRAHAAGYAARSLACYHHTALHLDFEEYLEQVRELVDEFPDRFGEDVTFQAREEDPRRWVRRAGELFDRGDVERAEKLLNDVCHGTGDYEGAALGAFRKHYAALGWQWATALCDFRAPTS